MEDRGWGGKGKEGEGEEEMGRREGRESPSGGEKGGNWKGEAVSRPWQHWFNGYTKMRLLDTL